MWHAITSNLANKSPWFRILECAKIKSTATCSDVRPRFHRQPPSFRYEQHHFPQGQHASKSVQSLEATILDPQVLIGGQQRTNLAIPSTSLLHPFYIPSTSFYILPHPATSFCILSHSCSHPPSQTFRYQHTFCPTNSAFQNLFKA